MFKKVELQRFAAASGHKFGANANVPSPAKLTTTTLRRNTTFSEGGGSLQKGKQFTSKRTLSPEVSDFCNANGLGALGVL